MRKGHPFQNEKGYSKPELFIFQDCFRSLFVFRIVFVSMYPTQPSDKLRSGLPHSVERPSNFCLWSREMGVYKMKIPKPPRKYGSWMFMVVKSKGMDFWDLNFEIHPPAITGVEREMERLNNFDTSQDVGRAGLFFPSKNIVTRSDTPNCQSACNMFPGK